MLAIILAGIIPTLSACKPFNSNAAQTAIVTATKEELEPFIYAALQTNSPTQVIVAEDFLYRLAGRVTNKQVIIDHLQGDRVHNLFSNNATRRALGELSIDPNPSTPEPEPIASGDQALIQAFQRVNDLTDQVSDRVIHAYIVTEGTTDPATLNSIKYLCGQIAASPNAANVRIYLIGLTPANRIPTSSALAPIAATAASAGSTYDEWMQHLRHL